MSKSDKWVVRVNAASQAAIKEHAAAKGLELGAAADALIATATGRRRALANYASKPRKAAQKPPSAV